MPKIKKHDKRLVMLLMAEGTSQGKSQSVDLTANNLPAEKCRIKMPKLQPSISYMNFFKSVTSQPSQAVKGQNVVIKILSE